MITFTHSGDLGDVLYALPTIAQLTDRAELVLTPSHNMVRQPWRADTVERVSSFFEAQPYITSVRFGERPDGPHRNLDEWRKHYRRRQNLSAAVAAHCGVDEWPVDQPWACVPPVQVSSNADFAAAVQPLQFGWAWEVGSRPVLVHRSPRYHSRDFPWVEAMELVRGRAAFVGSPDEHKTFCDQFGALPYLPTPTLLDLARVMSAVREAGGVFIGNQSTPRAVCESLKLNCWVEEDHWSQNTHYTRPGAAYGRYGMAEVRGWLA